MAVPFSVMIVEAYYRLFLDDAYEWRPGLRDLDYEASLRALLDEGMGTAGSYALNLRKLGHRASVVVVNDVGLQAKWARENGLRLGLPSLFDASIAQNRYCRRVLRPQKWLMRILRAQIEAEHPDVLLFTNPSWCEPSFMRGIRPHVGMVVGQIASTIPQKEYIRSCDLMVSSFQHFVDRFRAMGMPAEYLQLGFEASSVDVLRTRPETFETAFVGGLSGPEWVGGTAVLEGLAEASRLDVWGYGQETLRPDSPLRRRYHGHAWGHGVLNVFHNSKIVVNRHGEIAEDCANNVRLYEATGSGSLLVTDVKSNLADLFRIDEEIVAYRDGSDLISKVEYYLAHEDERSSIASAGHQRTLRDHSTLQRMHVLEQIIEAHS